MPFIHVYAYKGRDTETKKKAAEAMVKVASEAMGAPLEAFTVVYQDVEPDNWEKEIVKPVMEPLADKRLIKQGKLL